MSATNFNTSNSTYRKIIGNGLIYRVPAFQRDYSWTEEQWEDLWQDITETAVNNNEPSHYMGYLVLQSADDKTFDVIDGQQRLTTLSLIVLAALKSLQRLIEGNDDAESNKTRQTQLRQTYVGYLDPISLISKSKLSLNRNNDSYFQNYIVPLRQLPNYRIKASERTLRQSFEWFDKKIQERLRALPADINKGAAIASLIENMSDKLFFTVISVTDELNAYKVFETLNARGVRLSATDLLKNYLFSVLHREEQHQHELKVLEDRWESIVDRLNSEDFPDFLRAYWVSRYNSVRHADLYKAVRATIHDAAGVFELLRGMEDDIDAYLSLSNPEVSAWESTAKEHSKTLKMFGVRQAIPMLMAAHRKLAPQDFNSIISACVVIAYRYNVIGNLPPNEQEKLYQEIAQKISNEQYTSALQVITALRSTYPSDEKFKALFRDKTLDTTNSRNNKIAKYTYAKIEKQITNVDHEIFSEKYSIEHILPQNPEAGWDEFGDAEIESHIYRLGNMTLLEKSINKDLENKPYAQKKAGLLLSVFEITKCIANENPDWNTERISARQNQLANYATAIWRISQLSQT